MKPYPLDGIAVKLLMGDQVGFNGICPMSMNRLFVAFSSLLLATVFSTVGLAQYQGHSHNNGHAVGGNNFGQNGLRLGPAARPFGHPDPILDEDWYDYDAQMWAPFDIEGVDGHNHAPSGLFVGFDFATLSVGRPGNQFGALSGVDGGSDFHWGNKYLLGYMSESGVGFNASWLNVEGSFFPDGTASTIDTVRFNIVELNRAYRQEVSSGGYLEPYLGLRYTSLSDRTFQDVGNQRFRQTVSNSAFGAQIGSRYVRDIGTRLVLSMDGTIGGMYNSQSYNALDQQGNGANVFTTTSQRTVGGNDFVPFFDVDMGLQYRISRDISLRAGGILIYQWDGLARANNLPRATNPYSTVSGLATPVGPHVESLITAGFTFGVDWRR